VDTDGPERFGNVIGSPIDTELVGAVLEGRYRVDQPLARGGMSSVYRGVDLRLDRPVAIKVMESRFAADRSFIERFELEARAAARLHHPDVVAVHDQGVDGEHVYLVMELVDGGTLRDLLRERGSLALSVATSVLDPVLAALGAAHRAGLVHRDVKPENVLIGQDGAVKVADFGLVRAIASAGTTSNDVILGTVAYLSPEQVATGAADARSDVYSAGVLLYEMLTGVPPYQGDTPISVAYRHVNDDIPPPSELMPGIPAALDDLVLRATRRDPALRPVDAAAFQLELQRTRNALGLRAVSVPAPAPTEEAAHWPGGDADRTTTGLDSGRTRTISAGTLTADPDRTVRTLPPAAYGPPMAPGGPMGPQGTRAWTRSELGAPPVGPPVGPPQGGGRPPAPPYQAQRTRGRRNFLIWIAVVLVLAVVVGVGAWWLGSGRWTAVPTVGGLDVTTAEHVITDADLTVTVQQQHSDNVPPGRAITTDPASGARALRGSQVVLLMSEGKPVVPDITPGASLDVVQQAITAAGLRPVTAPQAAYNDTVPAGMVASVSPGPGSPVNSNSVVTITLSKGPPPKPVPNVVGSPRAQAFAALTQQGFSPYDLPQVFAQVAGGTVVATNPAAGTVVAPGADHKVGVEESDAVSVPQLTGMAVSQATSTLAALNLQIQVQQFVNTQDGQVFNQSVAAGTLVQPGSTITVAAFP
jgi:serine/threonine-protein kinase